MFNNIIEMTWKNPIFMFVFITAVWFIPGIVVRRIAEKKYKTDKADAQAKAIARLYPKDK